MRASAYRRWGKRWLDIVASAAGLLALSPLLAVVAALIKAADRGPVLYRQTRMGAGFRPFQIVKFRTMRPGVSGPGITQGSADPRVTPFGAFLRRSKLDELPQLYNVLRGDMSLVGPRPEIPKYVHLFEHDYRSILTVRPGITDFASVRFRDESAVLDGFADAELGYVQTVLPAKLALNRRYVGELSLATDLRILAATAREIVL